MSLFFRMHTDRRRTAVDLVDQYSAGTPSSCWLIGGGASLDELPLERIDRSPTPKMCVNLAGTQRLRPTFWTSYDPSVRFHKSIYFDPSVTKFVSSRRGMDLVPESTSKVCDCPNLYCFDGDSQRGFADFLSPAHDKIVDWNDTFVQGIDILYRLGFRTIYLAGCEMIVSPGAAWIAAAHQLGVDYSPGQLLSDFAQQCEKVGLSREQMQTFGTGRQYHFEESKPLQAAINTDQHYFRIAQYLRLCRRSITLAGLRIVSVTPSSRLNDYFPFLPIDDALAEIYLSVGNPAAESTQGLYAQTQDRRLPNLGPMRDYRPHHWKDGERPALKLEPEVVDPPSVIHERQRRVREFLEEIPEIELREEG